MTALTLGGVEAADHHELRYVPPLTSPTLNETPRITTEFRTYYLYNKIAHDFLSQGGHIHMLGFQGRYAANERLGIFISKAGYLFADFDQLLPEDDGPANVSGGVKYAFIAVPSKRTFVTAGIRYEAPLGDLETGIIELEGGGDGFFDLFSSAELPVGPRGGFETSAGLNFAVDTDHDTSAFHWSLHFDYEFFNGLFGIVESTLLTTFDEGNRTNGAVLGSFEGYDLFNFGNTNSGTIVTAAVGTRYRMTDHLLLGLGFEAPIGREDIVGFRMIFDLVAHF